MQLITSSDNQFHDGNSATGAIGTPLAAAWHNAVQGELVAPILAAGLTLDPTNNAQLLAAINILIEARAGNYGLDTGAVNAYVTALNPAIAAYVNGLQIKFRAAHANTGPCTLNAGGGVVSLLRDDGSALQAGDMPALSVVCATYDSAANAFLVNSVVASQFDVILQAGSPLYAADAGAANAYQAAYAPAITTLTDGMVLRFKVKTANTGASTFTPAFGSIAALPIWGGNHQPLQGGELIASGEVHLQLNMALNSGTGAWVLRTNTGGAMQIGQASQSLHAPQAQQVQSNSMTYAADTGAANAYVVSYTPAIAALTDGMMLEFQAKVANTGASTLNVNGLGAKPIIGSAHIALQSGEIVAGGQVQVEWHAGQNAWIMLENSGGATQVGTATQSQHAVPMGQIQSQSATAFATGGTAPAYTLTPTPAITAYANGQRFNVTFSTAGTTGSNTININKLGAIALEQFAADGTLSPAVVTAGLNSDVQVVGAGSYALLLDPLPPLNTQTYISTQTALAALSSTQSGASFNNGQGDGEFIHLQHPTAQGYAIQILAAAWGSGGLRWRSNISGTWGNWASLIDSTTTFQQLQNFTAAVASNALTGTLSSTSAAIQFRNPTLSTGTPVSATPAASLALTIPSGATLGSVSGQQSLFVWALLYNGGTPTLAVANISGGLDMSETGLISTTAISSGATANNVWYSAAAVTNSPYKILGVTVQTEATAGTYATGPSLVQPVGGEAFTAMMSAGVGQTWQSVTRAFGTTYYNPTGRTATEIIYMSLPNSSTVQLVLDGVNLGYVASNATTAGAIGFAVTVPIGPYGSYQLVASSGSPTIVNSAEKK